uniref:Variant surface glycoprotein (VSG), putative n=1 Tax=Trypanosoma brucei brucei (strain 927/4 GUTat10.1) TaxID=185431 RepID=Q4FKU8_TRYB2|nr:variant surface glycoprotein (VSG), putative [Trypanosoma brucei brucei TREU927]
MLKNIALLLVFATSSAKADQNDNGKEFRALCHLYKLALKSKVKNDAKQPPAIATIIDELNNLNISTATDSYFTAKDETVPAEGGEAKKTELTNWHENNKKLVGPTEDGKPSQYQRPAATATRSLANQQINNLLQAAKEAQTDSTGRMADAAAKRNAAHIALRRALYAARPEDASGAMYKDTKKKGCGNGSNGDDDAGQSILADFLCLCTHTGGAEPACLAAGDVEQVADDSPHAGAATAWSTIRGKCNIVTGPSELTSQTLTTVLQGVTNLVGKQYVNGQSHSPYVLGKHTGSNGCEGATNKNCINYKAQLTKGTGKIPWVIEVEKAIKELQEAEQIETSIAEAAYTLKDLASQGRNHYLAALHAPKEQTSTTQTKTSPTPEESKACEKYNGSQKECPQESCTYDEKENKCNHKAGTEPAATGTGEEAKEGAGTTGCSEKFNDKEKCEANKRCKWKNNTCKDSSII